MKSGPTLALATGTPRRARADMRPVATVVLPTPEWVPATTRRAPSSPTSVLDALLGGDAAVVGVLDLAHLGDRVGHLDELGRRVPAGDHDVRARRPLAEAGHHVVHRHPAVGHGVGELVEDKQVVVARGQLGPGDLPGVAALGRRLVEVGRLPGEAVTQGVPLDVEMVGELALTDLPLTTLDELDDAHPPASGPGPSHDAEGGRRLPLAVPGVHQDDGIGACHARHGSVGAAAQGTRWESGAVPQL